MTNEQAIKIFNNRANSRTVKFSEETKRTYLTYINSFLNSLDHPVEETTEKDVNDFLNKYSTYAEKTYNEVLLSIKALFKSLIMCMDLPEGTFKYDPTMRFETIRHPKTKVKHSIKESDYQRMLYRCTNKRNYAILVFLMNTGVRRDEIINIKLSQYIDRDIDNSIKLYVTKGSKERTIILNDDVISAVNEYLDERKDGCEYLFTSNTGNKMDASCLYKMIKNVAKRSNLDEDVIENISTHSFRHTSITNMVNKGYDISKIALFHGHSDTKTTMGYIDKDAVSLTELVR